MTDNQIAKVILDCAFEVHSTLGPGLLETVYRECLYYEIKSQGLFVEKEKILPVQYKKNQPGSWVQDRCPCREKNCNRTQNGRRAY